MSRTSLRQFFHLHLNVDCIRLFLFVNGLYLFQRALKALYEIIENVISIKTVYLEMTVNLLDDNTARIEMQGFES